MKRKRYTDEQVAYALRQAEAGTPIKEVCRKLGAVHSMARSQGGLDVLKQRHSKCRWTVSDRPC
jgi:putative transposase